MADQQLGNLHGVAAVHTGAGNQKTNMSGFNTAPSYGHFDLNQGHIFNMRARLAAIDAGFYTPARLNTMTYNDMMFAIRTADQSSTIKQ